MKRLTFAFRFLWVFPFLFIGIIPSAHADSKDQGKLMLEQIESQEEMRRRILTTVESAKQYQDMMDKQLKSLKHENKDLHEKLMKLKTQFESVLSPTHQEEASEVKAESAPAPSVPSSTAVAPVSSQVAADAPSDDGSSKQMPATTVTAELVEPPMSQQPQPILEASNHFLDKLLAAFVDLKFVVGVLLLGFLIALWFVWGRGARQAEKFNEPKGDSFAHHSADEKKKMHTADSAKDLAVPLQQMLVPLVSANQEGEYDYIGSVEGIPARLDLARMYQDMGDLAQAELVLKSILAQGDEKQSQEASKLLAEIKKI